MAGRFWYIRQKYVMLLLSSHFTWLVSFLEIITLDDNLRPMTDYDVINVFVEHLRINGHPGLHVDRWPDKGNLNSSDIDAIAGPFAIEHTSVDTLPNQRRDADWFMRAAGGKSRNFLLLRGFDSESFWSIKLSP